MMYITLQYVIIGATSHLPFFDLGPQARVLDDVDDITSLVNLPSSFYIGNLTFNTSYVRYQYY